MSGAKNASARASARHARAVAADHEQAGRRRVGARRNSARQIGDHQAFGAVGDAGERQRPAGRKEFGGRFRHASAIRVPLLRVEIAQPAEQRACRTPPARRARR